MIYLLSNIQFNLSNVMSKLFKMSAVGCRGAVESDMDSVKRDIAMTGNDRSRGVQILLEAQSHYFAMSKFRKERERNKRYTYGDQWSDMIWTEDGYMSEEDYISSQGNLPLKNNLIRRLVRNVIGAYRNQSLEPTCVARDRDEQQLGETMSTTLQYNMQLNRMTDLLARSLEEFLISGFIVHRKSYGWREGKEDCWTDYIQPNNFFIDSNIRDPRGWGCNIVGEIHDIDFNSLCEQFVQTPADYQRLAEIYKFAKDKQSIVTQWNSFGYSHKNDIANFLMPPNNSLCRVIEVWRKERKPQYKCHDWNSGEVFICDIADYEELVTSVNNKRLESAERYNMPQEEVPMIDAEWFIGTYWQYYFITPSGEILAEGESPYAHNSHPYAFKAYPYIDGEIHSFVSDFIDQQRYTNRLVSLYDWIMRASAKGVLMVPQDCIPKGMSVEDFASQWSKYNGVILYEPNKQGNIPQQISSNSTNVGITELLNMQLKFFEDISGVNGALQGKPGFSGMSASLYAQQVQNGTVSLMDLLETFSEFVRDGAYKDVKNIQQFYNDKKIINIVGKKGVVTYDPERIKDVEFDLSVVQSTATPAYRAVANDFLMQIWQTGQITLEQMLEAGNFPFADSLLQSVKAKQEEMQKQQEEQAQAQAQAQAQMAQGAQDMQGMSPEMLQGAGAMMPQAPQGMMPPMQG